MPHLHAARSLATRIADTRIAHTGIAEARTAVCAAAMAVALFSTQGAAAQNISAQPFVSGLNKPMDLAQCPGDPSRMFVAEQRGVIKLIKNGVVQASPFLDLDASIPDSMYTGLFGIAFHPDYQSNGKFYMHHTTGTSSAVVVWIKEYTRASGD
ncbi:MAG: PQQ-dependent sugar dehydrogenase, partial [Phycisphaerae bacterium]|nr:PQQ-dependent sugar dehydrogenase [Phycisphaerae bacterium]